MIGYPAGIITGVTYGLNPLFAVPLMRIGASVESILFFRYLFAVVLLGLWLLARREKIKISGRQAIVLLVLGLCYTSSSLLLFEAYRYIPSGVATTLVFLYPALVAVIMVFLKVVPSWPVWVSIVATFGGVMLMGCGDRGGSLNPAGVVLAVGSALSYALFIVIVNRSKTISSISSNVLTFYTLVVGMCVFAAIMEVHGVSATAGIKEVQAWISLILLALLPTVISTSTLAVATRNIGPTKASVLGVFEPITAILVGTLVFSEPLTPLMAVGIGIAVAAVTMMVMLTRR